MDFSCSGSKDMSGGLLILWRVSALDVLCNHRGPRYLGIKVSWKEILYYIFNVYFVCPAALKRTLWKKILDLKYILLMVMVDWWVFQC